MALVMALDPGLRGCGAAVYLDGVLQYARYVSNPVRVERGPPAWRMMARGVLAACPLAPDVLVLEGQYVSPRANPADILELCGVIGAITGAFDERARDIIRYLPNQWTGGVEKNERIVRLQSELTAEELSRFEMPTKSLQHNVFDAASLGMFEVRKRGERASNDDYDDEGSEGDESAID